MTSIQGTYLGWELLAHRTSCKRPQWVVDVRDDDYNFRNLYDGLDHSCPNEDCGHANRFIRTTVRIVCSACGTAHVLHGENVGNTSTSTAYLGFGLAPRKVAGLYLWPAEPWLNFGRAVSDEPHDFLITRRRVDRVSEADVVGQIVQGRGKRHGIVWSATAAPNPDGPYGVRLTSGGVRFAAATEGLRSVAAAAKWIAGQLAEKDTPRGDVHSADEVAGGNGE